MTRRTKLKLVPSLRARSLPNGRVVLTQKFIEGVNAFSRLWPGPVNVYMEGGENQSGNLDEVEIAPRDLPFEIRILPSEAISSEIVADNASVVLLSLDDCRQSGLSAVCRQNRVTCAYITEYSLNTRKQIVDAGTSNPLKRVRRKFWEKGEERKRRSAVENADGLQCNGTPTWESYRNLCPESLLYFDTRVPQELLATEEDIRTRVVESGPRGPLRLLYSGRLVASKGVKHLPEVAKNLANHRVDFHLFICGDGDLKPWLIDRIAAAQLHRHVTLKGVLDFRNELVPFVKRSVDLFVCCHAQGDPSCTYLETMSCGVPIVGYANEAFEGIVKNSGCGWAVPVNKPGLLADKIAEIGQRPEPLLAMSLASVGFATEHTLERTFSRRVHHLQRLEEKAPK